MTVFTLKIKIIKMEFWISTETLRLGSGEITALLHGRYATCQVTDVSYKE